jgi:tryptophan 2,3-dioxygenase
LLEEFERKYKKMFDHMKEYKSNIWQKFKQLPDGDQKNPDRCKKAISGSYG